MRLLLIADTHLPKRARALPSEVWDEIALADVVLHAGDWVSIEALDIVGSRAARLIGVYGNNDGPALRSRLPETAYADLGGLRFAVVHETGAAAGREARCAARYPDADVLVFGHSHIPWDSVAVNNRPTGLRLLNPGSPTDRRRQPAASYLTARVDAGALVDVTLHLLPPRPTVPRSPRLPSMAPTVTAASGTGYAQQTGQMTGYANPTAGAT